VIEGNEVLIVIILSIIAVGLILWIIKDDNEEGKEEIKGIKE
jgi:hypothetical protein